MDTSLRVHPGDLSPTTPLSKIFTMIFSMCGIGVLLPVGPVRIDVAANPNPGEGEDQWVAHFTLGMSF